MAHSFKSLAIHAVRQLIWEKLNTHQRNLTKPDIALVGSRRSGSTLLMQVIAQEKGIKSVNQPFSVYTATSSQLQDMPWPAGGLFISPSMEERGLLNTYIDKMCNGLIHVQEPWRFWQRDFYFKSNRLVLKTTNAHYLVDLLREAGLLVILYLRHPMPQAISCARNNWGDKLDHFATHHSLRTKILSNRQNQLLDETIQSGSKIDRYVLCWCLENLPLFEKIKEGAPAIFYEKMILDPDETISFLAEQCELSVTSRMREVFGKESLSVKGFSDSKGKSAIRSGDSSALIGRWLDEVDKSTLTSAEKILDTFPGCPYSAFSKMPKVL